MPDASLTWLGHASFRIDTPGTYYGECAELCGQNHADMRARVIALPPGQFRTWMHRQAADIKASQKLLGITRRLRGQGP